MTQCRILRIHGTRRDDSLKISFRRNKSKFIFHLNDVLKRAYLDLNTVTVILLRFLSGLVLLDVDSKD